MSSSCQIKSVKHLKNVYSLEMIPTLNTPIHILLSLNKFVILQLISQYHFVFCKHIALALSDLQY